MQQKKVSVIIPVYNEERFILRSVKSLLNTSYPHHLLEFIIVDGGSTDHTIDIIKQLQKTETVSIRLLYNPQRITPISLNMGIKAATGDIIIRADAHTIYPDGYIDTLLEWKHRLKADNIGGVFVHSPLYNTKVNHAIVAVLDSPFGVGNATYRHKRSGEPVEVDTVPFGAWDRSLFDRVGLFNEKLERNQDIELNKRIKALGGKIFLLPGLHLHYYPRSTWSEFVKYSFKNGMWNVLTVFVTRSFKSLSLRHFVPMFFVLALLSTLFLSLWSKIFLLLFLLIILTYLTAATIAAITVRRSGTTVFHIITTFFLWHFFYGLGETWGLIKALTKRKTYAT